MTATADKTARLKAFVDWTAKHIKGDEKGKPKYSSTDSFRRSDGRA